MLLWQCCAAPVCVLHVVSPAVIRCAGAAVLDGSSVGTACRQRAGLLTVSWYIGWRVLLLQRWLLQDAQHGSCLLVRQVTPCHMLSVRHISDTTIRALEPAHMHKQAFLPAMRCRHYTAQLQCKRPSSNLYLFKLTQSASVASLQIWSTLLDSNPKTLGALYV